MGKGIIRTIIFSLCFLLLSCAGAQAVHSEVSTFFTAIADRSVEIFVFDGFKLSPIIRAADVTTEKTPVTEGNYFVLYFVKDGSIPGVRVLKAGRKNIELGEIKLGGKINDDKGLITGAVYKTISGGKISYKKGILILFREVIVRAVGENGETYLTKSAENGVFSIILSPGKYKIFVNDSEGIDVMIKIGKTTVQNLPQGAMLID